MPDRVPTGRMTASSSRSRPSTISINDFLIKKMSEDFHNLKDAQDNLESQNNQLQQELNKLQNKDKSDRLVIDETLKSATSEEIADNFCKYE